MRKLLAMVVMICGMTAQLQAQLAVSPMETGTPTKKAEKAADKKEDKSGANKFLGPSTKTESNEPTTTEIYADEAFFDSNKSIGIFSSHVKVIDPRFNLQSDKLTVAEGNVAVVRDRPDPNGGPPTRSVGRSDKAVYTAATGDVELSGTPRVQEGLNTHLAASPDTVMIINQNGQLSTHGPSRTEIRQQPNEEKKPTPSPTPTSTP